MKKALSMSTSHSWSNGVVSNSMWRTESQSSIPQRYQTSPMTQTQPPKGLFRRSYSQSSIQYNAFDELEQERDKEDHAALNQPDNKSLKTEEAFTPREEGGRRSESDASGSHDMSLPIKKHSQDDSNDNSEFPSPMISSTSLGPSRASRESLMLISRAVSSEDDLDNLRRRKAILRKRISSDILIPSTHANPSSGNVMSQVLIARAHLRMRSSNCSRQSPDAVRRSTRMARRESMEKFRRAVSRVIWLNKMTGSAKKAPAFHQYVPAFVHQLTMDTIEDPFQREEGVIKSGAVLFADCSGFTKLGESLMAEGKGGAEELCSLINKFFQLIIDIAHNQGGVVVKFAGDAVMIVWLINPDDPSPTHNKTNKECAQRACIAALEMLKYCPYLAVDAPEEKDKVYLNLHMGVGVGNFGSFSIGGVLNSWEYILTGHPLSQIAIAEPTARSGEVVISPEVVELLKDIADHEPPHKFPEVENMHDEFGRELGKRQLHEYLSQFRKLNFVGQNNISPILRSEPSLPDEVEWRLSRYVPSVVRSKMDGSNTITNESIAETRKVTVLFINIKNLNLAPVNGKHANALHQAQTLMQECQRIVFNQRGQINKILIDDKGLLVLAVFGLPPLLNDDDGIRGVATALDLIKNVPLLFPSARKSLTTTVGITTGEVFAGTVGSTQRHEYTVMGDTVNTAARLMAAAEENDVLLDFRTLQYVLGVYSNFKYEKTPHLQLKGKNMKIQAFRPKDGEQPLLLQNIVAGSHQDMIISGREKEIEMGCEMVDKTKNAGGGVLYLFGEFGMGGSFVSNKISSYAEDSGFVLLKATTRRSNLGDQGTEQFVRVRHNLSSSIMNDSKWYTWKVVLQQMFDHLIMNGITDLYDWVMDCLRAYENQPDLSWTYPALKDLMDTFSAKRKTIDHTYGRRRRSTFKKEASLIRDMDIEQLIIRVIGSFTCMFPTFLAIRLEVRKHQGQGSLDHHSWQIIERLAASVNNRDEATTLEFQQPLVVFVMSEHLTEESPFAAFDVQRIALESGCLLELGLLGKEERLNWAAQCFTMEEPEGVVVHPASIPPLITLLLDRRAAGHPFIIHEIIRTLFHPDSCANNSGPTVKKWLTGRIEILLPNVFQLQVSEAMSKCALTLYEYLRGRLQDVAKAASIMPAFTPSMVNKVLNDGVSSNVVSKELEELVRVGMLNRCKGIPRCIDTYWPRDRMKASTYEFSNKLQQCKIVHLIPSKLRNNLKQNFVRRTSKILFSVITIQTQWRKYLARKYPTRKLADSYCHFSKALLNAAKEKQKENVGPGVSDGNKEMPTSKILKTTGSFPAIDLTFPKEVCSNFLTPPMMRIDEESETDDESDFASETFSDVSGKKSRFAYLTEKLTSAENRVNRLGSTCAVVNRELGDMLDKAIGLDKKLRNLLKKYNRA
eukprot:m.89486 g.89486  ORF g.89486 m.89486 type:complete len:1411 (-) comp8831_c0_seq1:226-4458(-)